MKLEQILNKNILKFGTKMFLVGTGIYLTINALADYGDECEEREKYLLPYENEEEVLFI